MRFQKQYGYSKVDKCPFCGKQSVTKNEQGVPVCPKHSKKELLDLKCVCGSWLDLRIGKFGPYFECMKCGNINFNRGLELNPQIMKEEEEQEEANEKEKRELKEEEQEKSRERKRYDPDDVETVVRSDEVDFL